MEHDPTKGSILIDYDTEMRLREQLWYSHGCGLHSLYGDDGEMVCNRTPHIDFKRWQFERILDLVDIHNHLRAAAFAAQAFQPDYPRSRTR